MKPDENRTWKIGDPVQVRWGDNWQKSRVTGLGNKTVIAPINATPEGRGGTLKFFYLDDVREVKR